MSSKGKEFALDVAKAVIFVIVANIAINAYKDAK